MFVSSILRSYVVDCGFVKQKIYNARTGLDALKVGCVFVRVSKRLATNHSMS